jgi:hypothetical protein
MKQHGGHVNVERQVPPDRLPNAGWAPLLSGESTDDVRRVVERIARHLCEADAAGGPKGPAASATEALVLDYLGRVLRDAAIRSVAEARLDDAVSSLATQSQHPALFGGFLGVALSAQLISSRSGVEFDLDDIDGAVFDMLDSGGGDLFDVISGLAGVGIYLLERPGGADVVRARRQVVEKLRELSVPMSAGVCWRMPVFERASSFLQRFPDAAFDTAFAHGSAGVISFLSEAYRADGSRDTGDLLAEAVGWLLKQRQPKGAGANFPDFVSSSDRAIVGMTRTAWCYGDPGIALALWNAGTAAGKETWRDIAIDVLCDVAERSVADCGVIDGCLCHGAAGLGHLLNRMYQRTGHPKMALGARRWLGVARGMAARIDEPEGFLFWRRPLNGQRSAWGPDRSLLNGAGGVALALAAAISEEAPDWDRMFGFGRG